MFIKNGLCRSAAVVAALSLATIASSSYASKNIQARDGDACTEVANYWAQGKQTIPAETAFNCLTSIPFDSKRSVFVLDQVRKFSQIYSAQAFFVKPPTLELRIRAVDLNGTLDEISNKASKADGYANDYEFNVALMTLFESYHDGHVFFKPSCATQFKFYHNYPLVVLQKDGEEIPGVYVIDPDTGMVGDEVQEIKGEEAHAHLERLVADLPGLWWIDADARWNELLASKHPIEGLYRGAFAWRDFWFEKSFPIKFKNGKTVEVEWSAYIMNDPMYTNAEEYLEYVCLDPYYQDTPERNNTVKTRPSTYPTHSLEEIPPYTTHPPKKVPKSTMEPSATSTDTYLPSATPTDTYQPESTDSDEPPTEKPPYEEDSSEGPYSTDYIHDDDWEYEDDDDYKPGLAGSHDDYPPDFTESHDISWPENGPSNSRPHYGPHYPWESYDPDWYYAKRSENQKIHRRLNDYLRNTKRDEGSTVAIQASQKPHQDESGSTNSPIKGDTYRPGPVEVEKLKAENPYHIANVPPTIPWPELQLKMGGNEQTLHVLDNKTVVWGIHTFADEEGNQAFYKAWVDFISAVFEFCKKEGKTRVLIDVSGNGGGYVSLGLETIRYLFPGASPYYGFDMRRSPALDLLIENSGWSPASHLDINNTRTVDGKDFASIEEFLGPVFKYNDYFTAQGRYDVESQVDELGLEPPPHKDPPFQPDQIVLVSDGRCGSTCAIFGEAISNLGIKSISLNGVADEKQGDKYMQHVGGIKGSQVWSWDVFMKDHVGKFIKNPEQYDFLPKRMPINHLTNMNLRNSYEPGSDLPLEFTWQPGNAHFYINKDEWLDKAKMWERCAKMAWDKDGKNLLKDVPKGVTNKFASEGGFKKEKSLAGDGKGKGSPQTVIGGDGEGYSYYILYWFKGIKELKVKGY